MRRWLVVTLLTISLSAVAAEPQTAILDVQNMTCDLCPITVRKSLERVPGVIAARIDLGTKTATVKFDPDRANAAVLVRATTDAGFPSAARR